MSACTAPVCPRPREVPAQPPPAPGPARRPPGWRAPWLTSPVPAAPWATSTSTASPAAPLPCVVTAWVLLSCSGVCMKATPMPSNIPGGIVGGGQDHVSVAKTTKLNQAALTDLLGRQHGVITRTQAATVGMTPGALRHRLRPGGPWQLFLPGVYLAQTGAPGSHQCEMAALLLAGPGSVLTGAAALSRHGLRPPRTATIDVLVQASRLRQSAGFARTAARSGCPRVSARRARSATHRCPAPSRTRSAGWVTTARPGPWLRRPSSRDTARCPCSRRS
jgi:hypothetical protein